MKNVLFLTLTILLLLPTFGVAAAPVNFITVEQYKTLQNEVKLLDVRSINSRNKSNLILQKAIWIDPHNESVLLDFIAKSDKNAVYVVFCSCKDDGYSIRLAQQLNDNGFTNVSVLKNGWNSIKDSGIKLAPLNPDEDCHCTDNWPDWHPPLRR
ncbi:MAG: rhodanese-like domain-containing protein [Pelosinus sp.]|nr:rhodanese-like domain-containing protein [Pelosinus sp.]